MWDGGDNNWKSIQTSGNFRRPTENSHDFQSIINIQVRTALDQLGHWDMHLTHIKNIQITNEEWKGKEWFEEIKKIQHIFLYLNNKLQ
jgi:hypothetical protein